MTTDTPRKFYTLACDADGYLTLVYYNTDNTQPSVILDRVSLRQIRRKLKLVDLAQYSDVVLAHAKILKHMAKHEEAIKSLTLTTEFKSIIDESLFDDYFACQIAKMVDLRGRPLKVNDTIVFTIDDKLLIGVIIDDYFPRMPTYPDTPVRIVVKSEPSSSYTVLPNEVIKLES